MDLSLAFGSVKVERIGTYNRLSHAPLFMRARLWMTRYLSQLIPVHSLSSVPVPNEQLPVVPAQVQYTSKEAPHGSDGFR